MKFEVHGEICAQGRPRFSSFKGHVRTYDPAKCRNYKALIAMVATDEMAAQDWKYTELPLLMTLDVLVPFVKSDSKKLHKEAAEGKAFPAKKPDVDNIAKIIMDALNGILYKDDKQIVELIIRKRYTEGAPMVKIELEVM